jgi:hypothetical protein
MAPVAERPPNKSINLSKSAPAEPTAAFAGYARRSPDMG